jgi:membrane protein YdbS with pleckstrin-like domain
MKQKDAALLIAYPAAFGLLWYFTSWKVSATLLALCVVCMAVMVSQVGDKHI